MFLAVFLILLILGGNKQIELKVVSNREPPGAGLMSSYGNKQIELKVIAAALLAYIVYRAVYKKQTDRTESHGMG